VKSSGSPSLSYKKLNIGAIAIAEATFKIFKAEFMYRRNFDILERLELGA